MLDSAPFLPSHQLSNCLDHIIPSSLTSKDEDGAKSVEASIATSPASLPLHPQVSLDDIEALKRFLKKDLCAPDLETMAPHMWILSTQSSANISALHHQRIHDRQVIISEDPRLHLVWISDRIFVKPLPEYLLSYAFWKFYLLNPDSPLGPDRDIIARSALGYLRTYYYLIRHPSDFKIALKKELIPADISLDQFQAFSSAFDFILDDEVSQRYAYGQLRLTRLNFYGKFILRRWNFQRMKWQSGEYLARFYGPLLFIFTTLSLILNALQLEIAVEQVVSNKDVGLSLWTGMWMLSRVVAVGIALVVATLATTLVGLLTYFHANEWHFAIKDRLRQRRQKIITKA
jgi:hypothetical protein